MFPPYKPFIPNGVSEIIDYLGMMMLDSQNLPRQDGLLPLAETWRLPLPN